MQAVSALLLLMLFCDIVLQLCLWQWMKHIGKMVNLVMYNVKIPLFFVFIQCN